MARASRGLPDDEPGLIAAAHQAVRAFASTMDHATDDHESRRRAESRIEAIVHKLTGHNDRWSEEAEQAQERLYASLRVDDGSVPIWGQPGRFVVTAAGCRVIVKVDGITHQVSRAVALLGTYGAVDTVGDPGPGLGVRMDRSMKP